MYELQVIMDPPEMWDEHKGFKTLINHVVAWDEQTLRRFMSRWHIPLWKLNYTKQGIPYFDVVNRHTRWSLKSRGVTPVTMYYMGQYLNKHYGL